MRKSYHNNTGFLDLLFNFLLATSILLVIAVLHIVIEQNKADIETKAEFVITMNWNDNQNNDVDIWVQDPRGKLLWYKNQETGIIHLDRDDRGWLDDIIVDSWGGGIETIKINQEIVTFRGVVPGEWVVNIHLFRIGDTPIDKQPTIVKLTFIKLNPKATIIFQKELELDTHWQQVTVARFKMTESGEIINLKNGPFKDLIMDNVGASRRYGASGVPANPIGE